MGLFAAHEAFLWPDRSFGFVEIHESFLFVPSTQDPSPRAPESRSRSDFVGLSAFEYHLHAFSGGEDSEAGAFLGAAGTPSPGLKGPAAFFPPTSPPSPQPTLA